ncbi:MAG: hypothetical protein SNJ52_01705, partial [Verrucomicrobiia bacterium]
MTLLTDQSIQTTVAMRHTHMRSFLLLAWCALLCAISAATLWAQPPAPIAVTIAPVRMAVIEDRVQALGSLRANESVDITTTIAEVVERLHFSDGDRVTQGQVLAELSATEEQALLVEAEATFEEAERQFERARRLAVGGAAAAAQLDEARRNFETARARKVAIQSRLDQ